MTTHTARALGTITTLMALSVSVTAAEGVQVPAPASEGQVRVTLSQRLGWDSNPNLRAAGIEDASGPTGSGADFGFGSNGTSVASVPPEADWFLHSLVSVVARLPRVPVVLKAGGWYRGYQELDGLDTASAYGGAALVLEAGKATFTPSYQYRATWIDGKDYLRTHRAELEWKQDWGGPLETTLAPYRLLKEGSNENAGLTGHQDGIEAEASLYFRQVPLLRRLSLGGEWSDYEADDAARNRMDWLVRGSARVALTKTTALEAIVSFNHREYTTTAREDERIEYGLEISQRLGRWFSVMAGYHHTDNQSTTASSEYQQDVVIVGVTARFP